MRKVLGVRLEEEFINEMKLFALKSNLSMQELVEKALLTYTSKQVDMLTTKEEIAHDNKLTTQQVNKFTWEEPEEIFIQLPDRRQALMPGEVIIEEREFNGNRFTRTRQADGKMWDYGLDTGGVFPVEEEEPEYTPEIDPDDPMEKILRDFEDRWK